MVHTHNMRPFVVYIPYSNDRVLQIPTSLHSTLPSTSDSAGYLSSSHEKFTCNHCKCDLARNTHQVPFIFPPSPPPTDSGPKRSIPLPSLGSNAEAGPSSPVSSRCRHRLEVSLGLTTKLLSFPALMTPPPTIPTQTLALPPAEVDMFTDLYLHDDWDASPHGQPSASGFPDQNDSMDPPLSPISPEWTTNGSYDMAPSSRNTKVLLCGDRIPEPESLPYYLQEPNDNNTSPHCRPILHRLDIPFPSPNITFSDSPTSPMDFDEELLPTPNTPNMDLDMDIPTTPESLPMSPFVHELAFSRDNRLFENDFRGEKYRTLFEPPPMHELEFLPELDDIPDSPSSPSLRSFSSLPSLYDDDDDDGLTSPPSPGATLLPLPGAEPEDDIRFSSDLDPHLPSGIPASPFGSSSGSLLLLEDEALPRSPSPENCDVDFVYAEDSADPDIRRLGELRRRSLHAERAARQFEQALLEQGAVHQRWEARRARKKEKERGREIGTMLRLKMMQEQDREETVKKGMISSMEQLVAKMLLRRNDTYRTLANRKTPLTSKFHKSSPLVPHDDSADVDMDDQQESWNPRWTSDSESESGPRTLSAWTSSLPQSSSSSF